MESEEQGGAVALEREGSFSRVWGALASPRATFDSIARKPSWLVPILLIVVVDIVLVFSFGRRIGWRAVYEKADRISPTFAQLTPQQQQQTIDRQVRLAPIENYVVVPIGVVIVLLIVAAIMLGAFNVVFGTSVRFAQSFAISAYAFMPLLLKNLLGIVVVWAHPPQGVDIQNVVMSNLAVFLPSGSPMWLKTLGTSLDVFVFWTIGLLAVGYAAASAKRVRFGSALAVVLTIWFVYVLAKVGIVALLLS